MSSDYQPTLGANQPTPAEVASIKSKFKGNRPTSADSNRLPLKIKAKKERDKDLKSDYGPIKARTRSEDREKFSGLAFRATSKPEVNVDDLKQSSARYNLLHNQPPPTQGVVIGQPVVADVSQTIDLGSKQGLEVLQQMNQMPTSSKRGKESTDDANTDAEELRKKERRLREKDAILQAQQEKLKLLEEMGKDLRERSRIQEDLDDLKSRGSSNSRSSYGRSSKASKTSKKMKKSKESKTATPTAEQQQPAGPMTMYNTTTTGATADQVAQATLAANIVGQAQGHQKGYQAGLQQGKSESQSSAAQYQAALEAELKSVKEAGDLAQKFAMLKEVEIRQLRLSAEESLKNSNDAARQDLQRATEDNFKLRFEAEKQRIETERIRLESQQDFRNLTEAARNEIQRANEDKAKLKAEADGLLAKVQETAHAAVAAAYIFAAS